MAVNGKSRRSYRGAPVSNTLGATLNAAATSITLAVAVSGWSTDGEPFFVVVDPGTAKEEKICVKYASSTTLTVVDPAATSTWGASSAGRGFDNTTDQSHATGAVIYPVFTATEANHANELVSKYANAGSVVYQGSGTPGTFTELAIGTANQVLTVNAGATAPQWNAIVNANVSASAAIALSKLATGALPTDITVASANLVDNTIVLGDLATALQKFLIPVGSINAFGGTTAPDGWLMCDGTSTTGYPTLITLVGATTPDLRGRTIVGVGTGAGLTARARNATGGEESVTLTSAQSGVPAHSHANTATSAVTITDPGHSHTIDTLDVGWAGSVIGVVEPGFAASAGDEANVVNSVTTGITASATVTVTNNPNTAANAASSHTNMQPFYALNYIIKHD
jgi:microcystin-dependent protein